MLEKRSVNEGYWGMGVKNGECYDLRFYLRTDEYKGGLIVRLLSSGGKVITNAAIKISKDPGWNEYKIPMIPGQTDTKARLTFGLGEKEQSGFYVSLFPENTFKNRPNGLRKDVANL